MIGLLQRVTEARVTVAGTTIGEISHGLLVLICAEPDDTELSTDRLLNRILTYRVFSDAQGKMNLSVKDVQGGLLLVPQFTLAADTRKGTRPSFSSAAPADIGEKLFRYITSRANQQHAPVATGQFGAHMQVSLTNDGPVTIWLRTEP